MKEAQELHRSRLHRNHVRLDHEVSKKEGSRRTLDKIRRPAPTAASKLCYWGSYSLPSASPSGSVTGGHEQGTADYKSAVYRL